MSLTFAGAELVGDSEELHARIHRWLDEQAPDLWAFPGNLTSGVDHIPAPEPPPARPPRLNTLVWPNGASRWAVFHALVTNDELVKIVAASNSTNFTTT